MSRAELEVTFRKRGASRFLAHLDLVRIFEQAARRADLPVRFTEGFNPRVRLSFPRALPLGVESECEKAVLGLQAPVDPGQAVEALNTRLPEGLEVTAAGPPEARGGDFLETYEVLLEDPRWEPGPEACRRVLDREALPVRRRKRDGSTREFDARPMLRSLEGPEPGRLRFGVASVEGRCLRVRELLDLLRTEAPDLPEPARVVLRSRVSLEP